MGKINACLPADKKVKIYTEITTAIYNTIEELNILKHLKLTESIAQMRDAYIIQSYTGLRVSDLFKLLENIKLFYRKENLQYFFEIKTHKTGKVVVIPIADIVEEILQRYNYEFPKMFKYNYYFTSIKLIGKKAKLNQEIQVSKTIGGKRVDTIMKKWQMMSTHTARRSFATNAFLAGIPTLQIMQITGHSTEKSFLKYIRSDSLTTAKIISSHEFFRNKKTPSIGNALLNLIKNIWYGKK